MLSVALCFIATGACSNLTIDTPLNTMGECDVAAREFMTAHADEMRARGYEFGGFMCRWVDRIHRR